MNALWKKEIRLLLPGFLICLAVAVASGLVAMNAPALESSLLTVLLVFVSPALVIIMALDSFGREMSAGTFSNLLSQPVSRSRIWWTKIVSLATAVLLAGIIWWISVNANPHFVLHRGEFIWIPVNAQPHFVLVRGEFWKAVGLTIAASLAIVTGCLWTVLLLRQVAAAFWLALIIPTALSLVTVSFAERFLKASEPAVMAVLGVYSIAGFILARWLFYRAQDVEWTGGVISMPQIRRREKVGSMTDGERDWRPRAALFWKELHLHQSQFVIAGVLALFHLGVLAFRSFGDFQHSPTLKLMLDGFWVIWFVMPLVIGCAAVAEECKLGTLESQLCLPVRRRTQFWIKLGSATLLSVVLALAVPLLLEGRRILPTGSFNFVGSIFALFSQSVGILGYVILQYFSSPVSQLLSLVGIAMVVFAVSFYASTLSRHTLQSLAPALLGIILTFVFFLGASSVDRFFPFLLWRGWLIYLIAVPVMTMVLLALMYRNFKRVLVGRPEWFGNLTILLSAAACVVALTTTLYHRAWELLTPLEPPRGAERIAQSNLPVMEMQWGGWMTMPFPDGKAWIGNLRFYWLPGKYPPLIHSQFLTDTNWSSIAAVREVNVAIKADGTLSLIETPAIPSVVPLNQPIVFPKTTAKITRVGSETNWQNVVREASLPAVILLKTDGTLWEWGTNQFDFKQSWPAWTSLPMRRLGADSDWSNMISISSSTYLWKKNGEAWALNPFYYWSKNDQVEISPGFRLQRVSLFDNTRWRKFASGEPFQVGVRDDGTLWGWGIFYASIFQNLNSSSGQIGFETNWVSVAATDSTIVGLKNDGSLWKWDVSYRMNPRLRSVTPVRLGEGNDWVEVAAGSGNVVSLAADGSLWGWQVDPSRYGLQIRPEMLFVPSRQPKKIGNIFETPNAP